MRTSALIKHYTGHIFVHICAYTVNYDMTVHQDALGVLFFQFSEGHMSKSPPTKNLRREGAGFTSLLNYLLADPCRVSFSSSLYTKHCVFQQLPGSVSHVCSSAYCCIIISAPTQSHSVYFPLCVQVLANKCNSLIG